MVASCICCSFDSGAIRHSSLCGIWRVVLVSTAVQSTQQAATSIKTTLPAPAFAIPIPRPTLDRQFSAVIEPRKRDDQASRRVRWFIHGLLLS